MCTAPLLIHLVLFCRFDTIFIVKDEHNEERDITLAKHVMSIHVNAGSAAAADAAAQDEGELSLQVLCFLLT